MGNDPTAKALLYAGAGLTVFCYSLGTNSDYRMQVMALLVGGLCLVWKERTARILAVTLVGIQFFSFPLGFPADLVNDIPMLVVVAYLTLLYIEVARRELIPRTPLRRGVPVRQEPQR